MLNTRQAIIQESLKQGAADGLRLRVSGHCMDPALTDGSFIRICRSNFYWPGDVLVFQDAGRGTLVHRLLGYYFRDGRWWFLTQADNGRSPDARSGSEQIVGRVSGVKVKPQQRMRAAGRFFLHALKAAFR